MFSRILIANRGEIACRIIRSARRMGMRCIAVYSDADATARHVRLADEAIRIGPAPARESYLVASRILEAAARTGAQAIHPGYGFLSENAGFAEACTAAGIAFIGPPAAAMRALGSKSAAKTLMERAGVPLVPGYHGENQEPDFLAGQAQAIGYPVLIKASAGGGGKGMRVVERAEDFAPALASCKREAASSFGDARVLIEKYLVRPRHIEIQVFADAHGNCVHLFERDCSVQRRHQKVLEEAPAPGMSGQRRAAMGEAACDAARAAGYVGAGTVEFIVEPDGTFHFMEMNTRLQVEHPVTEMITGLDLVEWQLRIAAGEVLPLAQEQIAIHGHALEARIYAEDPAKGFLPSTGRLIHLAAPPESVNVRIDTGVEEGDEIGPHYDPMIAKLIVWDASPENARERARARMLQSLAQVRVVGVASNVDFLSRLVACPAFAGADLDTTLIERERAFLFPEEAAAPSEVFLVAALAELLREEEEAGAAASTHGDPHSPWHLRDGWRLNSEFRRSLVFRFGQAENTVAVRYAGSGYELELEGRAVAASGRRTGNGMLDAQLAGVRVPATVVAVGEKRHVFLRGRAWQLACIDPLHHAGEGATVAGGLLAPMPGKIIALVATPGVTVEKGAPLLILEAMKMEHTLAAPAKGKVRRFRFDLGDSVGEGAELVDFEADEG
ncbi:MAG: acetyl/propionyl/methylcrotonyl-CoA carboxylase subunit alpha [Rhodocyclaceae bacterium]